MRDGHYAPGTADGRRLLAHELTHVAQQSADPGTPAVQHAKKGPFRTVWSGDKKPGRLGNLQRRLGIKPAPGAPSLLISCSGCRVPAGRWRRSYCTRPSSRGVSLDDSETVTAYLTRWLETKAPTLKPNSVNRYTAYIHNDLTPAFGAVALERLTHTHVAQFIARELAAGRGPVTLRRCVTTLSSALNDARRNHRLPHNAARFAKIPRPSRHELTRRSTDHASAFLWHCRNPRSANHPR